MSPATGFESFLIARVATLNCFVDAALQGHRVRTSGDRLHAFAVIALRQHRGVVVPSPAMSLVFEATSRTICRAHIFQGGP